MREKLGVLLIEDSQGQVSVQLFADPEKARETFRQLNSSTKLRATFLVVDWQGKKVETEVKELPQASEKGIDYWVIGAGPVYVKPYGAQA